MFLICTTYPLGILGSVMNLFHRGASVNQRHREKICAALEASPSPKGVAASDGAPGQPAGTRSKRSSSPQEPHRHRAASPADPAAHHVTLSGSPGMPDFESANDTIYVPI